MIQTIWSTFEYLIVAGVLLAVGYICVSMGLGMIMALFNFK
jgi:hypothetical protein